MLESTVNRKLQMAVLAPRVGFGVQAALGDPSRLALIGLKESPSLAGQSICSGLVCLTQCPCTLSFEKGFGSYLRESTAPDLWSTRGYEYIGN